MNVFITHYGFRNMTGLQNRDLLILRTRYITKRDRPRWKRRIHVCEINFPRVGLGDVRRAVFPSHKLDNREFRLCIIYGLWGTRECGRLRKLDASCVCISRYQFISEFISFLILFKLE